MKFITLITLSILMASCGTTKNTTMSESTENEPTNTTPTTVNIIKVTGELGEISETTDPFTIEATEIRGNLLYVDVMYSGGCEEHSFEVIGSNMIAKSMPPIRAIQVKHNANGDSCKKAVRAKLEVNIKEFAYKQEKGSEIYLTVNGKDRILYTFE